MVAKRTGTAKHIGLWVDYENVRGCGYDAFLRHEPSRERWDENQHKGARKHIKLSHLGDSIATKIRQDIDQSLPANERDSIDVYACKGGDRDQLITGNERFQAEIKTTKKIRRGVTLWPEESRQGATKKGERGVDVDLVVNFFQSVRRSQHDIAILFSMDRDVLTVIDYLESVLQRGTPAIYLCTWSPGNSESPDESGFGPAKVVKNVKRDAQTSGELEILELDRYVYRRAT